MRVDDVGTSFAWNDFDIANETHPKIVQTIDGIAKTKMLESINCASGRIEAGGKIDSDGKPSAEVKFVIEFG